MIERKATVNRTTSETTIKAELSIDSDGTSTIDTGIGFLDHMLSALARHARWQLTLTCRGDLFIDDHHTSEDVAIVLGTAFDQALGQRAGIARFGYAYAPMDEALARAVVDISSRGSANISLGLTRETIGTWSCENIEHFFISFATSARITLHMDVEKGKNDHHKAEAAFKSFALAIKAASLVTDRRDVPSTKGVLS